MFKKYDAYKDSGVYWIGNIPSHWMRKKIKSIANIYNGDSLSPDMKAKFSINTDCSNPYVSSKDIDVDTSTLSYETGLSIPLSFSKYKLAPKNSVLLCIEGGSAGRKIAFTETEVNFVNKLACFYSRNINNKFIFYYLKSQSFQVQFKLALSGLIGGVSLSSLENFEIYCPSRTEQDQIVSFLDNKITELDQAIAIKEQQITLLNERKQIVIQKAVTQGLDPNVPMKNSGVEWIGQIPEHWNIHKLSYVAKLDSGSTPDRSNMRFWTNGTIPWLKTGEINYNLITQAEEFVTPLALSKSALKLAPKGTVLMAMYGQGITRGRVAILDIDATYNQACCAIQCKKGLFNKYLFQFFSFAYSFIRDGGNETSQMNISTGYISNLKVLVPPLNEQEQIVSYLDLELQKFSDLKALLKLEIEKLREYKTTLINDAVTGKIKVV